MSLYALPTSQNPPRWNLSWLSDLCTTRMDAESEWLARDKLEANLLTIKPETVSHAAEQSSCFLPLLLSAQMPLHNKVSCFVSMYVSLDNSLLSVRQEPTLRSLKGSPFLPKNIQLSVHDSWPSEIMHACMLGCFSCPTHCDPVGCSPSASSVHGILQARILEWVAMSSSGGSSQSRAQTLFCLHLLHCRRSLYLSSHLESTMR